jgi:hypothetical protein
MAFVAELGPTLLAAFTAVAIAAFCWNRLRIGSVVVLVWSAAAIAVAQFPLFAGFPDWQAGDERGFVIFGTLAFMPAALLLLAAWRVHRVRVALARIPTSAWLATQATRFGGIFLIAAYLRGELPAEVSPGPIVLDSCPSLLRCAQAAFTVVRTPDRTWQATGIIPRPSPAYTAFGVFRPRLECRRFPL